MGSRHYQLGYKLALLETNVKTNGPIDCIMVGSSIVDVGFTPQSFQNGYYKTSGQSIRCFNFGIDASSMASTAAFTNILVEDYKPRLLILGTDARDYVINPDDKDPAVLLDTPWIKYRSGEFYLEGWLLDHSYLFRYRQHLSRLAHFNFENTLWSEAQLNYPILLDGFTPLSKVSTYINNQPDLQDESFEVRYYNTIYSSYQMLDENLVSLESIMNYNDENTQVIIVEMPVSDGLYYFFGNGEADYDKFVAHVSELADLHQVPFWRTEPLDTIPDNGWSDYSHLNVTGAEIFSLWLGEQVGRLEVQKDAGVFQPIANSTQ